MVNDESRPLKSWGFEIPLRHPVREVTSRRGIVVEGPAGWGEYSPFPGYSDGRQGHCWRAACSAASEEWPPSVRSEIPVHVTVPAVGADDAFRLVTESGCSAAKVKVAEGDDEPRLEAVRDALGPGGFITIDSNGAWDVDEASKKIKQLARFGIGLAEQPVAGFEEMRRLRKMVDVPIAADEMIRHADDAVRAAKEEAADALVIKVQHFGGIQNTLDAVERAGIPGIVSSLIESSIGIAVSAAAAAALPELPYPCGLATALLLEADLVGEPLVPRYGLLQVRRPQGNIELLKRYAADVDVPGDS